jgi:hypothetical protein
MDVGTQLRFSLGEAPKGRVHLIWLTLIWRRHVFHGAKAFWQDTNGKTASAKSSEACLLGIGYQSLTAALHRGLHLTLVDNPAQARSTIGGQRMEC